MALLVRHGVGDSIRQPFAFIQTSYTEHLSCGVILAPCREMNPKMLDQLKEFIGKFERGLSTSYFLDEQRMILWIVLDNQKLAGAHYISLILKEFLQNHGLLEGKIGVASFPESGEPTEAALFQLVEIITEKEEGTNDIHLYLNPTNGEEIPSILVVDSDEISREFVKLRLELKGYEVIEAKDGFEALEKFSQASPDLVITELNLPILDGYQLISSIQKNQDHEGKVMVLTEKHLPQTMDRAFELGASDYITKPFSISELEWRIKKLVNY